MEGVTAHALLDTGSRVMIVNLKIQVRVLAEKRAAGQTSAEWMVAVEGWFQPPSVPLKSKR